MSPLLQNRKPIPQTKMDNAHGVVLSWPDDRSPSFRHFWNLWAYLEKLEDHSDGGRYGCSGCYKFMKSLKLRWPNSFPTGSSGAVRPGTETLRRLGSPASLGTRESSGITPVEGFKRYCDSWCMNINMQDVAYHGAHKACFLRFKRILFASGKPSL